MYFPIQSKVSNFYLSEDVLYYQNLIWPDHILLKVLLFLRLLQRIPQTRLGMLCSSNIHLLRICAIFFPVVVVSFSFTFDQISSSITCSPKATSLQFLNPKSGLNPINFQKLYSSQTNFRFCTGFFFSTDMAYNLTLTISSKKFSRESEPNPGLGPHGLSNTLLYMLPAGCLELQEVFTQFFMYFFFS